MQYDCEYSLHHYDPAVSRYQASSCFNNGALRRLKTPGASCASAVTSVPFLTGKAVVYLLQIFYRCLPVSFCLLRDKKNKAARGGPIFGRAGASACVYTILTAMDAPHNKQPLGTRCNCLFLELPLSSGLLCVAPFNCRVVMAIADDDCVDAACCSTPLLRLYV